MQPRNAVLWHDTGDLYSPTNINCSSWQTCGSASNTYDKSWLWWRLKLSSTLMQLNCRCQIKTVSPSSLLFEGHFPFLHLTHQNRLHSHLPRHPLLPTFSKLASYQKTAWLGQQVTSAQQISPDIVHWASLSKQMRSRTTHLVQASRCGGRCIFHRSLLATAVN